MAIHRCFPFDSATGAGFLVGINWLIGEEGLESCAEVCAIGGARVGAGAI